MLGMALLAWAMLASGALAGSLAGGGAPYMAGAMQVAAAYAPPARCEGMSMRQADSQQAPVMPAGHGCCQTGCHCLSLWGVVLTVPPLAVAGSRPQATLPALAILAFAQTPAAPPLRPPIA
jgi:hypothetical protein